jgi:Haem-binding domain
MTIFSTSVKVVAGLAVAVLFSIQLVQPERTNPRSDPRLAFEAIANPPHQLASSLRRACGDCHSNETRWPWYSRISPVSWLIVKDVREGRAHFNLSTWSQGETGQESPETQELCAEVKAGKMPPRAYASLHPSSKLSASELEALCAFPFAEPVVTGQ